VIEKILETIFEATGEGLPKGEGYHLMLLKQAFLRLPQHPAVLRGEDLRDFLDELRRYQHFFRNIYRSSIKPENIRRLIEMIQKHHQSVYAQLREFTEVIAESEG